MSALRPAEVRAWPLAVATTLLVHGALFALPWRMDPAQSTEAPPLRVVLEQVAEPPPPQPPPPPPRPEPDLPPPTAPPTAHPPAPPNRPVQTPRPALRRPVKTAAKPLAEGTRTPPPDSAPLPDDAPPDPAPAVPVAAAAGQAPEVASAAPAPAGPDMGAWGRAIRTSVLTRRRYPRTARRLGLEGVAIVRIELLPDGSLAGVPRLKQSSGHEVLDAEALRMIRAAAPFAPPPGRLDGARSAFTVPIRFDLGEP